MRFRRILVTFASLVLLAAPVAPASAGATGSPACITREQFVLDFDQAAGISPIYPAVPTFADVTPSSRYYGYVEAAVKDGIINGMSATTFGPLGCLTRAQIAKIEVLGLGYGPQADALAFHITALADDNTIPSWARGFVAEAVAIGLVHGYPDNTFRPDQSMTAADEGFFIAQFKTALANKDFSISASSNDVGAGEQSTLSATGTTEAVTYAVASASAHMSGASFTATQPGTYVVTGTTSGGARAELTITVYGTPAALTVHVPSAIIANTMASETVTVDIVDALGNTVADASDSITLSGYGQALTAPTQATVAAVHGMASFSFKAGTAIGATDTLTATDDSDAALPTTTTKTPALALGLLVTTTADNINGDVSSVAALMADPGPDGISLREAITATNNSPGTYTIGFAPSLQGATIDVGSTGWGLCRR